MTLVDEGRPQLLPPTAWRPPLSAAERRSLGVALVATVVLGTYGVVDGAHNTIGYVASVIVVTGALARVRRQPLPPALAAALAALVIGHLAGGLLSVGDDVLYNADPDVEALQYDHLFHAAASAVAAVTLWGLTRTHVTSVSVGLLFAGLGALGLGALNELVEFASTLAHDGGHVGGYLNTGWDFVSNALGVTVACILLGITSRRDRT